MAGIKKNIYRKYNLLFRLLNPIIDLRRLYMSIPAYVRFFKSFIQYRKQSGKEKPAFRNLYPCLYDNTATTVFDRHYVYHPAWAMRTIRKINPEFHIDISSTLHFSTMLSAFLPVKFYDFRPPVLLLPDLEVGHADLKNLKFQTESIKSLSCMHTIEHIGLGRYGDPIDPEGDIRAINELSRVTCPGGHLLIVVPVGIQKVQFNGQRTYSYDWIVTKFDDFILREFSLIPDNKNSGIIWDADPQTVILQENGCGCFWFQKVSQ